jgi:hypothetical protein
VAGENAHGVAAQAEKRGVAEGDQTAMPERDVEADAGQRQDRGAGGERDEKRLVGEMPISGPPSSTSANALR